MRINVLGHLEVKNANGQVPLAGQRQRGLLTALALDHGRVVPAHRLIDVMWDDAPSHRAGQGAGTRLRAAAGFSQQAQDPTGPLLTCPAGYLLRVADHELDLAEFASLTARAAVAARLGETAAAVEHLTSALALWRGEACVDVASPLIRAAAAALEERRLLAIEAKAEAELALGRCDAVAAELAAHVANYPLRERLRALLMLSWYRLGCRADALSVYRAGRQVMVAELGLEPGPQLRRLHQRILADDPSLRAAVPRRLEAISGASA